MGWKDGSVVKSVITAFVDYPGPVPSGHMTPYNAHGLLLLLLIFDFVCLFV